MRIVLFVLACLVAFGQTSVRVNVGGPSYTDTGLRVYSADTGCASSLTFARGGTISNTSDPTLYQTGRSDNNTVSCSYTVNNYAFYFVTLKFAETDTSVTRVGQRIMNIFVNGSKLLPNFDILAYSLQPNTAVDLTFGPIAVTDSTITILVTTVTGKPVLQAVSIDSTGGGGGGSGASFEFVTFSSSPTFNGAAGTVKSFQTTLTGNISSCTLTNFTVGQIFTVIFPQDGTGSRTVTCPALTNLQDQEGTASSTCSQTFVFDGINYRALGYSLCTDTGKGGMSCIEGNSMSGSSGKDQMYCDSTSHRWRMNNNNSGATNVVGISDFPACADTGGQHLNQSGGAISCGTSGSGGTYSFSAGSSGNVSLTTSNATVYTTGANVTALASGRCMELKFVLLADAQYDVAVFVGATQIANPTGGGHESANVYNIYDYLYCNNAGTQATQTLTQFYTGYASNYAAGGAWVNFFHAAGLTTPTAIDWSTGSKTITVQMKVTSGTGTGNGYAFTIQTL